MKYTIKHLFQLIVICLLLGSLTACACKHEFGEWTTTQEATCTDEGVLTRICTKCGEEETEAIELKEHTWEEATCIAPKTCSSCGTTEGEAAGHVWEDATCTKPKTCQACGETEGEPNGHMWTKATCTTAKTCSVCGETDGSPLGHSYSVGKCTVCGVEDPQYDKIVSALTDMERYPVYMKSQKDIMASYYDLFKLNGSTSVYADAYKTATDMYNYLDKIIKLCGNYSDLSSLKKACEDAKGNMPALPAVVSTSTMRSYISSAKSFAKQTYYSVDAAYSAACEAYGLA